MKTTKSIVKPYQLRVVLPEAAIGVGIVPEPELGTLILVPIELRQDRFIWRCVLNHVGKNVRLTSVSSDWLEDWTREA